MKFCEIISDLEITQSQGDLDVDVDFLTTDSREITKDSQTLFVALRGLREDGHQYISSAIEKGACALVAESLDGIIEKFPAVCVGNTRLVLPKLAARIYGEPSRHMTVIGVTGTNGKTTIAYLLEALLEAAQKSCGVTGTVNYRFGKEVLPSAMTTPESHDYQRLLARMRAQKVTHVISEISSHALKMNRCAEVDFDLAIFTNLTRDHFDFHADMEDYFQAKALLFTQHLEKSRKLRKHAVINLDDPFGERLLHGHHVPVLTYSTKNPKADFFAKKSKFSAQGMEARLKTPWGEAEFRSLLLGQHNLSNCLAALASGYALGLDPSLILRSLATFSRIPGRLEPVQSSGHFSKTVLVDYAHTPDALENVLSTLRPLLNKPAKLFCLFGCGGDRDPGKRPLMAQIAAKGSDFVMITSDNPRTEDPQKILQEIQGGLPSSYTNFQVEADRRRAIQKAIALMKEKDFLLIAGKGHEKYQIVGRERLAFDDVMVAREVLEDLESSCT